MKLSIRPLILPFCFLILNAVGLWQGLRIWQSHLQDSSRDPVLLSGPSDKEALQGLQALSWEWDQPVTPPDQLGVLPGVPPVRMIPFHPGSFRWESEKKLTFEPSSPWPAARHIDLDLQLLTTNAAQRVFSLRHSTRLNGPALKVVKADPFLDERREQLQVRVRFNTAVDISSLQKHVKVLTNEGEVVEADIQETPQADEVLIHASWSGDKDGKLVIQNGVESVHGEGGVLAEDHACELRALNRFTLTGVEVRQPTFGSAELELSFSEPPAFQSVMDGLKIEPEVRVSVGEGRWWRGESCMVTGDFQPGKKYRIHLQNGVISKTGRALQREVEKNIIIPQRNPGLKFAHAGNILNAAGAKHLQLDVENEGGLRLKLERVHANNVVNASVRSTDPNDWIARRNPTRMLGKVVWEEEDYKVESGSVDLDLSTVLDETGQGIYHLQITGKTSGHTISKVIALSDLGVLARENGEQLQIWVLKLDSATPVKAGEVKLWSATRQLLATVRTDENGLCVVPKGDEEENGIPMVVTAQAGESFGVLDLSTLQPFPAKNGSRPFLAEGNEAFVYTERGMYRPKETVYARTIIRGKSFSLPGVFPVEWRLQNQAGLTVWKGLTTLSEVGTAEVKIPLQGEWPNGSYRIRVSLPGDDAPVWGEASLFIESFVPPQLVVKADTPDGDTGVPEVFRVQVDAQMLYGAPAAHHQGKAILTLSPEEFRSSEYPDYTFSDVRKDTFSFWTGPLGEFKTDEMGGHEVTVRVPENKEGPSALRAVVGISVNEFSGREASAFLSRRVDRVPYYVGLKSDRPGRGRVRVHLLGVFPDGKRIMENPNLELSWYRVSWQRGYRRNSSGRYTYYSDEVAVLEGEKEVRLDAGEKELVLEVMDDAIYRVAVKDPATGFSSSIRVVMGNASMAPARADQVSLSLNQASYAPGAEAVLSYHAPFAGRCLVTVGDDRFRLVESFEAKEREGTFTFTVPESGAGNLWVRTTVIRPQPGGGAAPVLRSDGAIPLNLDSGHLVKPLELKVAEKLMPSESAELRLTGEPGAEVVVAGVDEGILLLSSFETPQPLKWFFALRRAGGGSWDSFDDLLPEFGKTLLAGEVKMGGGFGASIGRRLNPVDAKRFTSMAWWSGAQTIPESGELIVQMPMPEFTGKVRWMAVQVSARGMGHAEAFSLVGREVVVQQSLPLFLAPGDRSRWTFRIHNQSDESKTVTLMPSSKGPVEVEDSGKVFTLKPGEVWMHELSVKAMSAIGRADFTMGVKVGDLFWQERLELAVRPVEAFEVRSKRFLLSPGKEIPLDPGSEMLTGTGKRQVMAVSTPVLQLAGARDFLMRYPYGCLEQTVSAVAPALYLPDWSAETKDAAEQQIRAGIHELWKKQRRDGSFGYWIRSDRVSVSGTFYAMDFLLEAKKRGFDVDKRSMDSALRWTKNWLMKQPWSEADSLEMVQACKVLALADELDAGWLQQLRDRKEDMSGYARVIAAEALMICGQRPFALDMVDTLRSVEHGSGWHSRSSGNAEFLWLLLKLNPRDGRIVPLVEDLLEKRNAGGRWAHTYENASVLRALVAYEKAWPSGEGEMQVVLKTDNGKEVRLEENIAVDVNETLKGRWVNTGDQPAYVEIREEGIPLKAMPVKNTFRVKRDLVHLDGTVVDRNEKLKSGETLLLRFQISNLGGKTDALVLDQRLPAGLEPFASSRQDKPEKKLQKKVDVTVTPPRYLEVRDDRILLFPWEVDAGTKVFYVLVKSVTPGTYTFPAVFAQDMYDEEMVFRGETQIVEVRP